MIKILKAVCKAWQSEKVDNEIRPLKKAKWAIAHKVDKQNHEQILLVEIVPFAMQENEAPASRVLH